MTLLKCVAGGFEFDGSIDVTIVTLVKTFPVAVWVRVHTTSSQNLSRREDYWVIVTDVKVDVDYATIPEVPLRSSRATPTTLTEHAIRTLRGSRKVTFSQIEEQNLRCGQGKEDQNISRERAYKVSSSFTWNRGQRDFKTTVA